MSTDSRASDLRLRFPNASASFLKLHGLGPGSPKEPVSPPIPMPDTPQPLKSSPSAHIAPKKGRLRQSSTGLNKTEQAFKDYLKADNTDILVQAVTLKIANGCRYTPDFITIEMPNITAYEVKGFMRDDAAVKLKVAATTYPWIQFHLVTRNKGEWLIQDVIP